MSEKHIIADRKSVLKAAEAVWGANKYFVLACSQHSYLEIRRHFREGHLTAAYQELRQTEMDFVDIPSAELPQLENALYHILGYFKKKVSQEERQMMNKMIPDEPGEALNLLKEWTFRQDVDYLKPCRLWQRKQAFQLVPVPIQNKERSTFMWEGTLLYSIS